MNSVNQAYELNHNDQLWSEESVRNKEEKQNQKERAQATREQHTILNRIISGGSISALFLMLFLLVTPMLQKWSSVWGNRDAYDKDDVYSFYYNDSYTITLPDGTTKIIEYYNPKAEEESPYMEEVLNYEELRDVYNSTENNETIQSVEGFLSSLDTVMDVGRGMYKYFARLVDVGQSVFNPVNHTINKLWNWLKDPFN